MKIKTSELTGAALDWAVAKCEGHDMEYFQVVDAYFPSEDWAQGGPIIEREWLDITPWPNESREYMRWHCQQYDTAGDCAQFGPTPLIAAMRCFCCANFGDEVEIPEELHPQNPKP